MFGKIWRLLLSIFDYRNHIRLLKKLHIIDVVFISNMRDETDKKIFFGRKTINKEFSSNHRIWFNKYIAGRLLVIHCLTQDLFTLSGRKKYKRQIWSVAKWSNEKKVKVVLFAASTKRLIDDGKRLRNEFPNLLFTIGDNGTVLLLKNDTMNILDKCGLNNNNCKILIIGPYGFLGEAMLKILLKKEFNIIGVGSNNGGLIKINKEYNIPVFEDFNNVGKVDVVLACTHSDKTKLNSEIIEKIRHDNKKLIIIDVAEPSNLTKQEYLQCKEKVIRIDAGNAYSKNIKYVLGYISYKMMRLQQGVTFGCFAEAMVLATELKKSKSGNYLKNIDWLVINDHNIEIIETLFNKYGIVNPSFRCFGKEIRNFDIRLNENCSINDRDYIIKAHINKIKTWTKNGGPDKEDWEVFNQWVDSLFIDKKRYNFCSEEIKQIQLAFGDSLNVDTIHGHAYKKPLGYSGDFLIIDKFYTNQLICDEKYKKWDMHGQNTIAAKAIRNRKEYFKNLLLLKLNSYPEGFSVLNLACGSCRDIKELFDYNTNLRVRIDCLEQDNRAIEFASCLLDGYSNRIQFIHQNAIKFRTNQKYDLIWSGGLFDYFNDDIFIRLLKRYYTFVKVGGEIVIGNFSTKNPNKNYMDLMGWHLFYRDEEKLLELVNKCGFDNIDIAIGNEPEGVNLFLHLKKSG